MPTIRAASRVSRQVISRIWIIAPSLRDQHAFALGMEVVEELVPSRRETRQVDRDLLAGLNHALAVQLEALALDRERRRVGDLQADLGPAGRRDLRRLEAGLVHGERHRDVVRPYGTDQDERQ